MGGRRRIRWIGDMKSDATPAGGSGDTEARPGPRRCVPCADSRPGPSDDLHARLKAPHCLASRLLAPLPVMLALAVIACGVLVFVLARQGDDRHEARRREFLLSAVEEFRTAFTDFTRRRAIDVATPSMFKDAMAFGRSDVSLAPSGSTRYRHDHAYLVDAEGRLLASYPDGEDRVPLAVRRLLADLRAEGGARQHSATSGADVTGSVDRPGLSDYVAVDEEPLLAAVVVARNPLVMAGDETT